MVNSQTIILIIVAVAAVYFLYVRKDGYGSGFGWGLMNPNSLGGGGIYNPNPRRENYEGSLNYGDKFLGGGDSLQDLSDVPRIQDDVVPFSTAAANPTQQFFMANPSVQLKGRLAQLADPMRGDINIRMDPGIPMVDRSQYGRESLKLDGTFSQAGADLFAKLTSGSESDNVPRTISGYKNMPQFVSNQGTIMS